MSNMEVSCGGEKIPGGSGSSSWVAAQRLVLNRDHSRTVIQRIIAQLVHCLDQDQEDQVQQIMSLLSSIRDQKGVVCCLLSEQLNSPNHRVRHLICNSLSNFTGHVNKDVVAKLTFLMMDDPSFPVCVAAAEALVKLGKVQHVHSELRSKLEAEFEGPTEALILIGSSQIDLEKLLEPIMSCFSNQLPAVRAQACRMVAAVLIRTKPILFQVVRQMMELMEHDLVKDVRLAAVNAVRALGLSCRHVQETLLRCLETEEEAELRLAVCQLLPRTGITAGELNQFLLGRVHVETSEAVRRAMEEVLKGNKCSLDGRKDRRLLQVHMRRVCDPSIIIQKVLFLDHRFPWRPVDGRSPLVSDTKHQTEYQQLVCDDQKCGSKSVLLD